MASKSASVTSASLLSALIGLARSLKVEVCPTLASFSVFKFPRRNYVSPMSVGSLIGNIDNDSTPIGAVNTCTNILLVII